MGEITTGAENDLKEAAKLARRMVTKWGMSEELGVMAIPSDGDNPFLGYEMTQAREIGEGLATQIDLATRRLVEEAHQQALKILTANQSLLHDLAARLLSDETLSRDELAEIWSPAEQNGQPSLAAAAVSDGEGEGAVSEPAG